MPNVAIPQSSYSSIDLNCIFVLDINTAKGNLSGLSIEFIKQISKLPIATNHQTSSLGMALNYQGFDEGGSTELKRLETIDATFKDESMRKAWNALIGQPGPQRQEGYFDSQSKFSPG